MIVAMIDKWHVSNKFVLLAVVSFQLLYATSSQWSRKYFKREIIAAEQMCILYVQMLQIRTFVPLDPGQRQLREEICNGK